MSRQVASIKMTEARSIHILVNNFCKGPGIVSWEGKELIESNSEWSAFPNGSLISTSFNAALFNFK